MISFEGEPLLDVIEDSLSTVEPWTKDKVPSKNGRVVQLARLTFGAARRQHNLLRNAVKEINGQSSLVEAVKAEPAGDIGSIALMD